MVKARQNYDYKKVSKPLICEDPHLALQSEKDACDINLILKRATKTGVGLAAPTSAPVYVDFTNLPDFHESMNVVAKANQLFAGLDAKIRKRFSNDPREFVAYCLDEDNRSEMQKLGLIKAPVATEGKSNGESDSGASKGNSAGPADSSSSAETKAGGAAAK